MISVASKQFVQEECQGFTTGMGKSSVLEAEHKSGEVKEVAMTSA